MLIKETTIRLVELLIIFTRTTKTSQRIFHSSILIYENIFSGIKLVIFLRFLKHKTTIQRKLSDVMSSCVNLSWNTISFVFRLLVVLSITTMNVGNRWHSTAGPKINVMNDFWAKTCSAVCPWQRVECVSFSNSKLLDLKTS